MEGKDAVVVSNHPDSNYASYKSLHVISWKIFRIPQYLEYGYFDFDIEKSIPKNVKINKAVLRLFADTTNPYHGAAGHIEYTKYETWRLNIITSNWQEDSICWNNQPEVEKTDFITVQSPDYSSQAFSVDVTKYVKRKVLKSSDIYGFRLNFGLGYPSEPQETIALRFCSSDHQNSELWPELKIEYEY